MISPSGLSLLKQLDDAIIGLLKYNYAIHTFSACDRPVGSKKTASRILPRSKYNYVFHKTVFYPESRLVGLEDHASYFILSRALISLWSKINDVARVPEEN